MIALLKNNKSLLGIIFFAAALRLYGIHWDKGFMLHPDERAIIMFSLPLSLPQTLLEFFSPQSPLNPHFFAYGNFPLYLLKSLASLFGLIDLSFSTYPKIYIVGRLLSVFFDVGTVIIIASLGKKVFNKTVGLLAAFFYSISVLPIQLAHFYAVDTPLTFFVITTLYLLILFYQRPTLLKATCIGLLFGLSLATKNSALVLAISIIAAIEIDFFLLIIHRPHKIKTWIHHLPKFIKHLCVYGAVILFVTPFTFILFEPYAVISYNEFLQQTKAQYAMTHNAFTFPYTLQYVGKIPYLYEVKNIFFWGQGVVLATICIAGVLFVSFRSIIKKQSQELILIIFFWAYFLVVGGFAIGFMRYLLPIYPLLCLFGSYLVITMSPVIKQRFGPSVFHIVSKIFFVLLMIWPLSFVQIYGREHTRINATNWIANEIPAGKTIAIEHWDDSLPLRGQERYHIETLELYTTDTSSKWNKIQQQLKKSDYIIIASNRLYTPLQKLTDCEKVPSYFCYKETASYYQNLFNGQLGFKKAAEFTSYPTIPFINIPIIDEAADESFTVYDHPKIMIFKKQ